jgi:aspartate racemase
MKKIGMIGGLAWPSTAAYYRELCARTGARAEARGARPPLPSPPMVIESLDISVTRGLRGAAGDEASWARYDRVFRDAFARLRAAGAEIGLIASNTPHTRLEAITRGTDLAVVSILEATAEATARLGAGRARARHARRRRGARTRRHDA